MKTFAVSYVVSSIPENAGIVGAQLRAFAHLRRADRVFLVDAESARKAENAVKRYCQKRGLDVIRINEGVEAERLPSA